MRFHALACDYDGTLATEGRVDATSLAALERLVASGRRLLLVTGRQLDDLLEVFPHCSLFSYIVAENGAHLFQPKSGEHRLLGEAPPPDFIEALKGASVSPLSCGEVIVATWRPHEVAVIEAICNLDLELQVIFNKGAVMVLPSGVNKRTGFEVALETLGLSPHNVVAVGDAENDHALLQAAGFSVAVANALPRLKREADWVTPSARGAGVTELIERMLADDLASFERAHFKRGVLMGHREDGSEVWLAQSGVNLLVCGPSSGGKTTLASGLMERWTERRQQLCLIDPEGDYDTLEDAVILGDGVHAPSVGEVIQVLKHPRENVVVNLLSVPLAERPIFFAALLPRILELRAAYGRPHWLVIDEAHHLLPAAYTPTPEELPPLVEGIMLITVHPDRLSPAVLAAIDAVVAVGERPDVTLSLFARPLGLEAPPLPLPPRGEGYVVAWFHRDRESPFYLRPTTTKRLVHRHRRKYAIGELGIDKSFYFRGPEGRLRLRAQNLSLFLQIGEGVDEDTWRFHSERRHYSRWFREAIKDEELARVTELLEDDTALDIADARARLRALIEGRYTAAA